MATELEKRLKDVMKDAIADSEIMGMNLLVEKDGQEMVYCQEGLADREKKKEIQRDSIFRLYSQTKPVTAAAAMILMEQGKLDLCQPVMEILPAFAKQKVSEDGKLVDPIRPLLVHDLLRMTSGLLYPDDSTVAGAASAKVFEEACARIHTENAMSTRELADRLAECPLAFHPGTQWAYGTSADILGAVIEEISGQRFSDFMEEHIFAPLGMKDTAFWVPEEKRDRLVTVYGTEQQEDGTRGMSIYTGDHLAIRNDMAELPAYEAGGAGLTSTVDDYMKFAKMLLRKGELDGKRILKPATVEYFENGELMPSQQKYFENWIGLDGYSYGNLMRVCKNPSQAGGMCREGECGWDGWLGMYFANFPKENMTIIMGMQKKDAGTFKLTRKLRNIILSEI